MFRNLYNAVKEPFETSQEFQTNFYQDQQNRFQGVEPNRLLPNTVPSAVGIVSQLETVKAAVKSYDPYTEQSRVPFNDSVLGSLLQGSPAQSPRVTECRQFNGITGIEQLLQQQAANPNQPLRCGIRYQKSSGIVPLVARGAYGTAQGPISTDVEDSVGGNVQWIWDLEKARRLLLTDSANNMGNCSALTTLSAVENGAYNGKLGFCKVSNKFIPLSNSRAAYPTIDTLACPTEQIVTSSALCPVQEGFADTTATDSSCLASGSATLTRDCLLRAVQFAGCSDQGSMYMALQGADIGGPFDDTLKKQKAFQDYQSAQGSAAITQNLFQKDKGSMNMALTEISRLKGAIQSSPSMKVKKAAEDLCLQAGIYDTYDFCGDITDGTIIGSVKLVCIQRYWQKKNGKPAGARYPKGNADAAAMGNTWKAYKNFVDDLEAKTKSTDASVQRRAFLDFFGIQPGPTPQLRVPMDNSTKGVEVVWFDDSKTTLLTPNAACLLMRRVNLSSANMALPMIADGTGAITPVGLSSNVSFQAFWDFRLSQDAQLFLKTYCDDGFRFMVNRAVTDMGSTTDTFSRFVAQGSGVFQTNTNTTGLTLSSLNPNIISLEYFNKTGNHAFSTEFALQPQGASMPALTPLYSSQGIVNNNWKESVVLTQELSAPFISIEVCRRTLANPATDAYTAENNKIAFQDRRLFSRGLVLQRNGEPSFQVTSAQRINTPGNAPFVRLVDGQSFNSLSRVAFQALQCFTLCFRIPVALSKNQSVSLFSWINLDVGYTQRIGYTVTVMNDGYSSKVSIELRGNHGTSTHVMPLPIATGASAPCYILVALMDHFEGNTQGVSFVLDTASHFENTGTYPMNARVSVTKPSNVASFLGNYTLSKNNTGQLRFGGVGSMDLVWFHGFDYKLEEGEQLKREGRNGWIRTWFQPDL